MSMGRVYYTCDVSSRLFGAYTLEAAPQRSMIECKLTIRVFYSEGIRRG